MIRDKIRFMMNCKGPLHYNKLIYVSTWDEESGKDITRRKKYIKSAYKWTTMTLEKRMAAHSIILAWRIPWTEEPGGYSPWGHKESDMTETTEQAPPKSSLLWDWLAFVLTLMDPSDGGILLPALHMAVSWQSGGGRALSGLLSHSWGLHPHDLSTSQNLHPLQCCLTGGEHFNMNLGGGVVIDT